MIYSFNYKRGTQVFDNVKSLADAINFELPRNWDCRNEMEAKTNEIDAFMQKKVSCAHLGVVGLFDSYTPHMATTMLNATWYCAVSAYDKAIRNLHCVVRMHTGFDYPYAVGVGTSLAEFRQSRLEAQADEALRQVCRAFEEHGADMIGAVLKMLETIRNDAEQDSYVDEFLNFNEYEFEVDEDGCFVGVH